MMGVALAFCGLATGAGCNELTGISPYHLDTSDSSSSDVNPDVPFIEGDAGIDGAGDGDDDGPFDAVSDADLAKMSDACDQIAAASCGTETMNCCTKFFTGYNAIK